MFMHHGKLTYTIDLMNALVGFDSSAMQLERSLGCNILNSFRCGHCKEFDKTFKKLAKALSSPQLLFAKMDGVANDLPPALEVRGYPTIFFLKAASKHEPVLYDGDRTYSHVKVCVRFILYFYEELTYITYRISSICSIYSEFLC